MTKNVSSIKENFVREWTHGVDDLVKHFTMVGGVAGLLGGPLIAATNPNLDVAHGFMMGLAIAGSLPLPVVAATLLFATAENAYSRTKNILGYASHKLKP